MDEAEFNKLYKPKIERALNKIMKSKNGTGSVSLIIDDNKIQKIITTIEEEETEA